MKLRKLKMFLRFYNKMVGNPRDTTCKMLDCCSFLHKLYQLSNAPSPHRIDGSALYRSIDLVHNNSWTPPPRCRDGVGRQQQHLSLSYELVYYYNAFIDVLLKLKLPDAKTENNISVKLIFPVSLYFPTPLFDALNSRVVVRHIIINPTCCSPFSPCSFQTGSLASR